MLAQNFKTPTDLGISDAEFDALFKVLGMLERGEIQPEHFDMARVQHECGTPACICGWANHVSNGEAFKLRPRLLYGDPILEPMWNELTSGILRLFNYGTYCGAAVNKASPDQAAIALRNYLTHGEPRWAEALA